LNDEVSKLQYKMEQDHLGMRESSMDLIEREKALLVNQLATEKKRASELQGETSSLRHENEDLRRIVTELEINHERSFSDLKSELKLKNFEVTRLSLLQDESKERCRLFEMASKKLEEELIIRKEAFHQLDVESQARERGLSQSNLELEGQLKLYERLEAEYDEAILTSTLGDNNPLSSFPTNPSRRTQHAIHMAQKLLSEEKENDHLRQQVKVCLLLFFLV